RRSRPCAEGSRPHRWRAASSVIMEYSNGRCRSSLFFKKHGRTTSLEACTLRKLCHEFGEDALFCIRHRLEGADKTLLCYVRCFLYKCSAFCRKRDGHLSAVVGIGRCTDVLSVAQFLYDDRDGALMGIGPFGKFVDRQSIL